MFQIHGLSSFLATALLAACAVASAKNDARSTTDSESVSAHDELLETLPPLPSPKLAVPNGSRLAFHYDAVGVQIYSCRATANGFAWTFQGPEASLFDGRGHLVVKHYGGPTWEAAGDHSKVAAKKLEEISSDAHAIPELLLQATEHEGKGQMAPISYIQRLDTVGGLAPSDGCDAEHVGAAARVDYKAKYFFYRPAHNK